MLMGWQYLFLPFLQIFCSFLLVLLCFGLFLLLVFCELPVWILILARRVLVCSCSFARWLGLGLGLWLCVSPSL
jgi:hypothetical protein